MQILDTCKVYFSDEPTSFPTYGSSPQEIVSGRASLIYVSCSLVIPQQTLQAVSYNGALAVDNRCYYLCGSSDQDDVFLKICPFWGTTENTMIQFNYPIGGNGILFPEGIYIGKDANAPDGSSTAQDFTYSISLFYVGS